jgi:hypothetical protein
VISVLQVCGRKGLPLAAFKKKKKPMSSMHPKFHVKRTSITTTSVMFGNAAAVAATFLKNLKILFLFKFNMVYMF